MAVSMSRLRVPCLQVVAWDLIPICYTDISDALSATMRGNKQAWRVRGTCCAQLFMSLELGMNILRREKVSQQHFYFKLEPDFSPNSQNLSSFKNTFLDTTQSTLSQRKDCTWTETTIVQVSLFAKRWKNVSTKKNQLHQFAAYWWEKVEGHGLLPGITEVLFRLIFKVTSH